jgi:maltose O-acetyltransferase
VVTSDIPDGSIAVGNPCRVIKTIAYSPTDDTETEI